MVDDEDKDPLEWLPTLNEWCPRITGVITLISSLCMMWMAWNRRGRLFHRLVLGMSFHLLVLGAFFYLWASSNSNQ